MTERRFQLKEYMIMTAPRSTFGPEYSPRLATSLAACASAISRLDARILVSSVAPAWRRRAAWAGYANALRLQSVEIDEIDVFSWGCELKIPGRPLLSSTLDPFEDFAPWQTALNEPDPLAWRDARPIASSEPEGATDHPALVRVLEQLRRDCRLDRSIIPWLGLPFALRDAGICASPLPCLAGGVKGFRLRKATDQSDWLRVLKVLEGAARTGLDRLHDLERVYRDAQRGIVAEYRPGALPRLLALTCFQPLLGPQTVADRLGLSVAGASKLLERAASIGLLVEIVERRSWRLFLTADLAITFGFAQPKRGRPRSAPPPPPADRAIAQIFDDFDRQMAEIDALIGHRIIAPERPES